MPRRPVLELRTAVDVLERVLDKGIIVERTSQADALSDADARRDLVVLGVDVRVEVTTELDDAAKDRLRH